MTAILSAFLTAFVLTYLIIPVIIQVAKDKRLLDQPNERSSHAEPTPSLGGIGIFAGAICGVVLWTPLAAFASLQYILTGFVLIFILGVLDDLLDISAIKKFLAQLLVTFILIIKGQMLVTSFYGVFGIEELPLFASYGISMLAIIGIINAFNLIDGINGLAGSIGLFACLLFGAWFYAVNQLALAIVALSLAGAIAAFLRYNFTPSRIFMGDTGSLLIGTVCAILSIKFIETNHTIPAYSPFVFGGAPALAVAVLFLPIYDTISSFIRRLVQGNSPFSPDKKHIHHQLLCLGLSHTQTTLVLMGINVSFVLITLPLHQLGTRFLLGLELILALMLAFFLHWLNKTVANA